MTSQKGEAGVRVCDSIPLVSRFTNLVPSHAFTVWRTWEDNDLGVIRLRKMLAATTSFEAAKAVARLFANDPEVVS